MASEDHDQPPTDGGTPVPDLIEQYRRRRSAWIAQADELARLRDEVRGSAEREAMEIVTTARRSVRQVIVDARRELLVLSAQVQAALGETTAQADPASLLQKAGLSVGDLQLPVGTPEPSFAPETAVDEILDEIQADMQALVNDARALPLQAPPPPSEPQATAAPESPEPPAATPQAASPSPPAEPEEPPSGWPWPRKRDAEPVAGAPLPETGQPEPTPAVALGSFQPPSEAVSRGLLSSPAAGASGESVAVLKGRSVRTFLGVFGGVGAVIVLVTVWWTRGPETPAQPEPERAAVAADETPGEGALPVAGAKAARAGERPTDESGTVAPTSAVTPPGGPVLGPGPVAGNLSLSAEAVREVWVRTTVDGEADAGRTLAPGQVITASADRSIALRAGDAGALLVSVNQGARAPLGPDGVVLTRQFLAGGAGEDAAAPVDDQRPASVLQAPAEAPRAAPEPPGAVPAPESPSVPVAAASPARSGQPAAASSDGAITPATAVVAAARRWLDAYHRQDAATMAALSTENLMLADERLPDERFPAGASNVQRSLDRVNVQVAADTAVLSAVMTEQSGSSAASLVSPVSQVWVRGADGQWRIRQARFLSEARLSQVFR